MSMEGNRMLALVTLSCLIHGGSTGIAEMISNYARVSTNKDLVPQSANNTSRNDSTKEKTISMSVNDTEEAIPDYEDFDDIEEKQRVSEKQKATQTFVKMFNGLVNILALLYKFDGKPMNPNKAHFNKPRQNTIASYINDVMAANTVNKDYTNINGFKVYQPQKNKAEDRYTPNTFNSYFYKKEKEQTEYPPYAGNSIKTSYDSDNEMYNKNTVDTYKPPKTDYQYWKPQEETPQAVSMDYGSWKPPKETPPAPSSWKPHDEAAPAPPDYESWQPPEEDHAMEDEDRDSKRPYSYYFLGRKLWYIPLLFSLYFILYIGALILKSVARHKIRFPEKLWELNDHHHGHGKDMDYLTDRFESAVKNVKYKYM